MQKYLEKMNEDSMKIILYSGDAHELFEKALIESEKSDFEACDELLKEGFQKLTEAHKIQTKIIQENIERECDDMSMLFVHAQDTMMSIQSEYHMIKHMIKLYRRLANYECKG